jgi:[acyl-carrier-protein] S-malonyltransferase
VADRFVLAATTPPSANRESGAVLAIVCPGQGAQTPGMLSPWLELTGVPEQLALLSEAAGLDLTAHGTTSDADTIRDTAVAQPLIVAAGLITAALLDQLPATAAGAVAGHSVGEFTAAALAGVLTQDQAVGLVAGRGRAMAEASALRPTGMSAVLGGDPAQVADTLARHGLTAANANGAGQVVAAGTTEQLAGLAADAPARARVIPLAVAGAFHTEHMAPAVDALARLAAAVTPADPIVPLLSNADGAIVADGRRALERLVDQVSNPVRWDACQETLRASGVTALIELTPAGALAGLAKRALPGISIVALKTPADLDAARALLAQGATPSGLDPSGVPA